MQTHKKFYELLIDVTTVTVNETHTHKRARARVSGMLNDASR